MYFKGNLVITDPCYIKSWKANKLMERSTIYGDWSCMVYPGTMEENDSFEEWSEKYLNFFNQYNFCKLGEDEKKKLQDEFNEFKDKWKKEKIIGQFAADSGMVALFDYDTLSDEDKEFVNTKTWCAAVINDFDGDVTFEVVGENVHVVGKGNKNFFSVQSLF